MASFSVGDKSDILYLCVGFRYLIEDTVTITGDSDKGAHMKLGVIVFLGLISAGCSLLAPPVYQESYFVPVIRSDTATSGYVPTVAPAVQRKERPRIYTPAFN